jgi:histidine triad (HIT) family protein
VTLSADKIADLRAKELEMIQAVIARMASYGATLKNYCITLATAVCGFAFTLNRPIAGLLALLPILVCALLDAQYLRNERRFRALFHKCRQQDWSTPPTYDIGLAAAPASSYGAALASWSVLLFYGPLALAAIAAILIARRSHGGFL